jgi:hypothetical protein
MVQRPITWRCNLDGVYFFLESRPAIANTYSQIYIQVVFAVEGRQNLITPERKEELAGPCGPEERD